MSRSSGRADSARRHQLEQLLLTGTTLDHNARERLLDSVCPGDELLKSQCRTLWQMMPEEEQSFSPPLIEPGQTIAQRFVIIDLVGTGGMGEVYRAQDRLLDRIVALKVVRGRAVNSQDLRKRLEEEARVVSRLAHPRICALYDLYFEQGSPVLVMEYLQGETLAIRLAREPMPQAEVIEIGIQVLQALSHAHKNGLIHRDLKPANVMLTASGVKVLDFGVAKRLKAQLAQATLHEAASGEPREGMLVGTLGYMSPEQALGKPIDGRSDLFSFGSMMHEAAARERAFGGDTALSTLSAVLHDEPTPLRQLNRGVSREFESFILRCLDKDPAHRFETADEAAEALEGIRVSAARRRARFRLAITAAVAVPLSLLAFFWGRSHSPAPEQQLTHLRRLTIGDVATSVSLSPDGSTAVYSSDRSGYLNLWRQRLDSGEAVQLTNDTSSESEPVFSPDGTQIAFRSDRNGGGIYVMAVAGGVPLLIGPKGRNPRYSPDGKWVAYWQGTPGAGDVMRVGSAKAFVASTRGGEVRQIATDLPNAGFPVFSPDGQSLMVITYEAEARAYYRLEFAGGKSTRLHLAQDFRKYKLQAPLVELWTRSGLFFTAGSATIRNIWYAPVSPDLSTLGPPQALTSGASQDMNLSISGSRVAYFSGEQHESIWATQLDADSGKPRGPALRTVSIPNDVAHPNLSPDGRFLSFAIMTPEYAALEMLDLVTGKEVLITKTRPHDMAVHFLGDSTTVYYDQSAGDEHRLFEWNRLTGATRLLFDNHGGAQGASSDGRWVSYWVRQPGGYNAIWVADRDSQQQAKVIEDRQRQLYVPHISPDGRWISFIARAGPESAQIFVAPFHGLNPIQVSEWIPITGGEGLNNKPEWSPQGKILYFVSDRDGHRCIWAQRIRISDLRPVGHPFAVQHLHDLRSSMLNVNLGRLELTVAQGRMAYLVAEQSGGIWLAELPKNITRAAD